MFQESGYSLCFAFVIICLVFGSLPNIVRGQEESHSTTTVSTSSASAPRKRVRLPQRNITVEWEYTLLTEKPAEPVQAPSPPPSVNNEDEVPTNESEATTSSVEFPFPFRVKSASMKTYDYSTAKKRLPKPQALTDTTTIMVEIPSENRSTERVPTYKMQKRYIDKMLVKYERSVRPFPKLGGPTVAYASFVIRSISSIDEKSMDFTMDFFLSQRWNDPRLSFDNAGYEQDIRYVQPSIEFSKSVWLPDGFFPLQRRGHGHVITAPNRLMRIFPNGDVHTTERYTIVLACEMFLSRYPFDVQNCEVELSSFSHNDQELKFLWAEEAVVVVMELDLPKFKLAKWEVIDCFFRDKTGNYSCLKFRLKFTREIGFHVIETYMPTTFLVVSSWMGFWIDATSVPARVSLAVTAMLTTVAQCSNIKHGLPAVSYIKAIDIWLYVCILYVFSSLVEFAIVNYLTTKETKRLKRLTEEIKNASTQPCTSCKMRKALDGGPDYTEVSGGNRLQRIRALLCCKCCAGPRRRPCLARQVDLMSRLFFPATFGLFAFIYLNVYAL